MKHKGYIYCIQNKVNGKKYVGRTIDSITSRWGQHIKNLNSNKHYNKYLQNDYNDVGISNFSFNVLNEFNFENINVLNQVLNDLEIIYINMWGLLDKNKGYNIADGGLNGNPYAGKSQDEMNELQEKRLKKIKGRKHTEESKNKMSKSHKIRNKGKKIICIETNIIFINSEDVIEKMFNGQGTSSNIRCNCRGITKSAYGYHFKYIE